MNRGRATWAPMGMAAIVAGVAWAAPADDMPDPRRDKCIGFLAHTDEYGLSAPEGLAYDDVRPALQAAIQYARHCPQPPGVRSLHLTFELVVGCDGLVSDLSVSEADGAPETYLTCVGDVLRKADFPPHDVADGFPVTYPLNVAW